MRHLSEKGLAAVDCAAARQGIPHDAALVLLASLLEGGGRQARFNHPELGGMGQWSQGAMTMIEDVANNDLKHRLDTLCVELNGMLGDGSNFSDHGPLRPHASDNGEQVTRPAFFQKSQSDI